MRSIGLISTALGVLGIGGAVYWWWSFYSQLSNNPPIQCLYSNDGACRAVSTVSSLLGASPYSPVALYAAVAALVLGIVLSAVARRR